MSNRSGKKTDRKTLMVRVICIALAVSMIASITIALLLNR